MNSGVRMLITWCYSEANVSYFNAKGVDMSVKTTPLIKGLTEL